MGTNTISHENKFLLAIATWGGSLVFHSFLILGSLVLFAQIAPTPKTSVSQWKVSLISPAPSSELSEHAQMVKHARVPTTRSTVSRPQPKRRILQQRRIQQRQPSLHQTAVVTRPTPQVIKSLVPTRKNFKHTPQSLPTPVTQFQTKVASTHQTIPTPQVMAKATSSSKHEHVIQQKSTHTSVRLSQPQVSSLTTQAHSVQKVRRSTPMTTTGAVIDTRKPHTSKPAAVHHEVLTSAPVTKMHRTFTKMAAQVHSGIPEQRTQSSMTHSHNSQRITSVVKQRIAPTIKRPAIFADAPTHHVTRKVPYHTRLTSISQKSIRSRQKRHSHDSQQSNGLSKEVLAFFKLLREKIEQHRQYPHMAKRLGYQGTTTVAFALSHAGNLTLLKVAEPSGHMMLDEAALEAVQNISPLKPPRTIGGTPIEIPVAFKLTR